MAIDLSKLTDLENPDLKQQINVIAKLEKGTTMFLSLKNQKEKCLIFR